MEISETQENQCAIVTIKGRIDSFTAPEFSEALKTAALGDINTIILDLKDVVFVSSAGLRVLIDTNKTLKRLNKDNLILTNVPQRVNETLDLAGFSPLFRFFSNVQSALEQI